MVKYIEKCFKIYRVEKHSKKDKKDSCHHSKKNLVLIPYHFAIISAFAPEQANLITQLSPRFKDIDYGGRRFIRGFYQDKLIVSVLCGVGIVNATMTAQILVDKFSPENILFSGISGGINPGNQIGDVVIAKRWFNIHHQKYIPTLKDGKGQITNSFFDTNVNFPNKFFTGPDQLVNNFTLPGPAGVNNPIEPPADNKIHPDQFPPLITSKFAIPMYVDNLTEGGDIYLPEVPQKFFFPVDKKLFKAAMRAIQKGIVLPPVCLNESCTDFYIPVVKTGDAGMSSSTFVDNAEWRLDVFDQFERDGVIVESVDMETVGISMVTASNHVPFLSVRSMSDLAGGDADESITNQFFQMAADNSVMTLLAIIKQV